VALRILVVGAAGFIGRHILAELVAAGHHVTGAVRHPSRLKQAFPSVKFVARDLARDLDASAWRGRLAGVDAVVNTAGLLRGPDMEAVHVVGPAALYRASADAGVKRAVLVSAISARADVDTDYARSKLAGERVLKESGLDWVLLRPSLVYAKGSFGGTSLLRGLAGLPFVIPVPGDGTQVFSPIHAGDLAHVIRIACESDRLVGQVLEPAGPETLTLRDLLVRYRGWLGLGAARFLSVPLRATRVLARLGDKLGSGPISSNSLAQLLAGNTGDGEAFARAVGFTPRTLGAALEAEPAEVQDRWHARLYFLAPALKASLVLLWVASGVLGLAYGSGATASLVQRLALPASWAEPLKIGSSLLDFAMAGLLLADRRGAMATIAQLVVALGYTIVLGIALPALWLDPFGPLLKNLPILAAILVNGAISDRR
jgi:uncharacterized protein YbjT (DUF2867 family)